MSGLPFNKISRRDFFGITIGSILLAACRNTNTISSFPGELIASGAGLGHMLRDNQFPEPVRSESSPIVIIGSGIAGLSAARWLSQNGHTHFILLELENETGGNAVAGKNELTAYPWAAHYLPLPNAECKNLLDFLRESAVLKGYDEKQQPLYDETMLCFEPQERLFIHGSWQNDIVPSLGLSKKERAGFESFFERMKQFRELKGSDGKPAFAIPIDDSSRDPELMQLDQLSMAAYSQQNGWNSPYLKWYINYCCSDDYGTPMEQTSAWAGIHYFASRRGTAGNVSNGSVLTWPEGNAFLARKLAAFSAQQTRKGHAVFKISTKDGQTVVSCYDSAKKESYSILAGRVICAVPQFVRQRLLPDVLADAVKTVSYAPWLVANLTVSNWSDGEGPPLSWDNVIYNSSSLGYVNAMHQSLRTHGNRTVLSYYYPVTDREPSEARKFLRSMDHDQFAQLIVAELKKAHPDAAKSIERIDVRLWGHAMVRPTLNYIWGKNRAALKEPVNDRIFFCHSDLSGISIFEEAFFQGIRAAKELIRSLS